jgi:hypothetical protein
MTTVKRKRTTGNRVWIGLLGFCLFVCVSMDCLFLYLLAIRWAPPSEMLTLLAVCSSLTWTTWRLLRRRLSISGADEFL